MLILFIKLIHMTVLGSKSTGSRVKKAEEVIT